MKSNSTATHSPILSAQEQPTEDAAAYPFSLNEVIPNSDFSIMDANLSESSMSIHPIHSIKEVSFNTSQKTTMKLTLNLINAASN